MIYLSSKHKKKPLTRNTEEGTFFGNYQEKILNSKNEEHLPKILRKKRKKIVQGGAEMIGGEIQRFLRDEGFMTTTVGVGDDSVDARKVEHAVRP